MKKLFAILSVFLFIPILSVSAAETVSFSISNVECRNNRLIDVEIRAKSPKKLSAALFEFYFDRNILEFRGASAPKGSDVVANENSERVRLSYLCTYGADISEETAIFTLEFKTLSEGSAPINFKVEDCVDSDILQMTAGSCTAGTVTITPKASDQVGRTDTQTKSKASSQTSKSEKSKSGKSSDKQSSSDKAKDTSQSSVNDLGELNTVMQKDADKLTPIIILCVSAAAGAALIGFIVYKLIEKKKGKGKDPGDHPEP